jgi:hypothetical protein
MLGAVQLAAIRVRQKPDSEKWLERLDSALRTAATDRSVEALLNMVFAQLPVPRELSDQRKYLADLLGRLETLSFLSVDPAGGQILSPHGLTTWLPWIDVLADLDVAALVPAKGIRWPDPALPHLVKRLMPMWTRVTDKSVFSTKRIRTGKSKADRHEFGEWVAQTIIRQAGVRPPPPWSVWTVVEELGK